MDDAATTAATSDFRAAQFHREHAVALETDVSDFDIFARELLARRGLDDGRAGASAEQ